MDETLVNHYKDELKDVVEYVKLAKSYDSSSHKCIIMSIAREEMQHANLLKHLLEHDGNFQNTDEIKQLKMAAEEALGYR